MATLLIKNIGMLATPRGAAALRGKMQGEAFLQKDAWVLCENGLIREAGQGEPPQPQGCAVLDAGGCLVTPGLVDAHTHLVFGGWRQNELGQKLHGASYLDILAAGGGILSTVRHTREATEQQLYEKARADLDEMLARGTTTCEAKSGYGLDLETELKQLRVAKRLAEEHPVELVSTFLGAHAVPQEYREDRAGYVRLLCETALPRVAAEGLAGYCDVFCEQGAFTLPESEQILMAAKRLGLGLKIHADEICAIGGAQLAGRLGAASAEHLIVCSEAGIAALAAGGTVACLLPATSLYLGAAYAPARRMIEAGVPVALATDYNPGSCPSSNQQLVLNLACLKYRMTPEEVLAGATLNGAAAIGLADRIGSIEPGKQADLVVWQAPDLDYLCYRMGSDLARVVVKKGAVVCDKRKENR